MINIVFIKDTRLKIKNKLQKIQKVKSEIKKNYTRYIKKEKQNYFGLDSFHFQNKIIDIEYDNLLELYHLIDNRIYGDYYKLFVMMVEYLKINLLPDQYDKIKELSKLKNYPIYKDLDNYKKYDFDVITSIHQDLITILSCVRDIVQENNILIKEHKKQLNYGINIDNYIISHEFINNNLDLTNNLHESYLDVYHKYHAKLLTNYLEKINLFFEQINNNIIDDTSSSNSISPRKIDTSLIDNNEENNFHVDINENIVIDFKNNEEKEINEVLNTNIDTNTLSQEESIDDNSDKDNEFTFVSKNKRKKRKKKN